jgi:hypothetical protein
MNRLLCICIDCVVIEVKKFYFTEEELEIVRGGIL